MGEPLADAYDERSRQLYEARGSLAEAVSVLTVELRHRQEENQAMKEALGAEVQQLRVHVSMLEGQVALLRSMKVVRWTAWPRRIVYRLRTGRP